MLCSGEVGSFKAVE
ncbi:hypothetical protein LINPERPRIM_LOCUS38874 [Linum perenne]